MWIPQLWFDSANKSWYNKQTYLHSTVEEAAVLARLVQQSFGGGQRQHAPRLVRFPQVASRPPEQLDPCHWIMASPFRQVEWSDDRAGWPDPSVPDGVTPQWSGAKLFHKLQQLPCYTWASSQFLQLYRQAFHLLHYLQVFLIKKLINQKPTKKITIQVFVLESLWWPVV